MVKTYTISNTSTSERDEKMSWERDEKKRLAEYLWTEINKAILKSPDVQFSIKKLQKLELLDYVAEFNLVLEVDKLIESILKKKMRRRKPKLNQSLKNYIFMPNLERTWKKKKHSAFPHPLLLIPHNGLTAKPCQKMKSALKNILTNGSMGNTG